MSSFGLALVAAFFWGLSSLFEKWALRTVDPWAGVVARTTGVVLGVIVFMLVSPEVPRRFLQMEGRARLALMTGGVMASVIAQIFFYRALKNGDIGRVASVGGSWPVFAFILSVFIFHESLTGAKALGILFVAMGVVLLK